jgi:hypothetical protein
VGAGIRTAGVISVLCISKASSHWCKDAINLRDMGIGYDQVHKDPRSRHRRRGALLHWESINIHPLYASKRDSLFVSPERGT